MVLQHREYQLTKATLISTDYGAGLQIGEFAKKKKKKVLTTKQLRHLS